MSTLAEKNVNELKKLLTEKQKGLYEFRFAISGTKTRDVKEGMRLRREIAQILTELNSRQDR